MKELEKNYYLKLRKLLCEYKMIGSEYLRKNVENRWKHDEKLYLEYMSQRKELGKYWLEFGNHIDKLARVYVSAFRVWQEEFKVEDVGNKKLFAALDFYIVSCVCDWIIDSGSRSIKKIEALERIKWSFLKPFFEGQNYIEQNNVLDTLFIYFFENITELKKEAKDIDGVLENIKLAFLSEYYTSTHELYEGCKVEKLDLLTDKSVSFVKATFGLACLGASNKEKLKESLEALSNAIWLIDDLCDIFIDVREKSNNPLLFDEKLKVDNIPVAIDRVYGNLESWVKILKQNLEKMEKSLSRECFEYTLDLICDWDEQIIVQNKV